ncbi:hypothetical protein D9758_010503 [Tetrapyrgos nigripes]|uniref:3-oxoacyl-[acyl-carrier-protein] reductase n=1 Tax=Tetrapyrgos nigripes TaxID=182062 RepID=A0A8H5CZJ5_9AGAR|nr:hypothetical protein D9758_010503 [Tetrapyrgos nigripes]
MSSSSERQLEGRIALITGCSGGIGKASAITLARRGCSIAVHYSQSADRAHALAEELQKSFQVRAAAFGADLSNYDNVRGLHSEVVQKLGHPDILFNNAGDTVKVIGRMGNIEDISVDLFEKTWKLNTGSQFLLTQLCLKHMVEQKYGRIVFNSSVAAGKFNRSHLVDYVLISQELMYL